MVDYGEDLVASPFHVIVRTDAPEHGRQPQISPSLVTQIPVIRCEREERDETVAH